MGELNERCAMCGNEIPDSAERWAPPDGLLGPAFHSLCAPPSQTEPDGPLILIGPDGRPVMEVGEWA